MKNIFLTLFLLIVIFMTAQEKKKAQKTPPIIYGEIFFGGFKVFDDNGGLFPGGELNYQYKKSLFSVRYLEYNQLKAELVQIPPIFGFPIVYQTNLNKEIAILYGLRWIKNGNSKSISVGISHNDYKSRLIDQNNQIYNVFDNFFGLPFEASIRWFNATKKRHRIYMIIPVGKPTAFSRNIGFKLVGNISKHSYFGLGLTYGLGYHKKY